jgi:hypothetical protein
MSIAAALFFAAVVAGIFHFTIVFQRLDSALFLPGS